MSKLPADSLSQSGHMPILASGLRAKLIPKGSRLRAGLTQTVTVIEVPSCSNLFRYPVATQSIGFSPFMYINTVSHNSHLCDLTCRRLHIHAIYIMLPEAIAKLRIAIVGASLGGLSAANVLHRLGAQVLVYESFPSGFHRRGGGLGGVDVELLHHIRGGSMLNSPRGRGYFYGDLWSYLYDGLPDGTVVFGADVQDIRGGSGKEQLPQLVVAFEKGSDPDRDTRSTGECINGDDIHRRETIEFDLIIGADGGKSTVRKYVTDQLPTYAGYTLWRGLVSREHVTDPPFGVTSVNGYTYKTMGFLCPGPPDSDGKTTELWNCGVYMALPESQAEKPNRNRQVSTPVISVPSWFLPVVRKLFGESTTQFWSACLKHGKVSPHPIWELACDRVVNGRIALLGDAAHMASPHTGAGAYTAMVDAVVLREAVQEGRSLDEALTLYNRDTTRRGQLLMVSSRRVGSQFCPPGKDPVAPESILQVFN
jgi:2-polyprenyl-6-methoxyphenol hydroxylase-like FAD-dependent oxidoreductase